MKKVIRYIDEYDVTASYGLAGDEYLMNQGMNPSLRLYTYRNYCALAGRFQEVNAEIDIEACKELDYDVNRRLTGGGAIIMGKDQLGICFTASSALFKWNHIRELYQQLAVPVIGAIRSFGIEASFRAKNDLEVAGKKIAGLGIHLDQNSNFHFHTSLLLDLDIRAMLRVLKIPIQKLEDKRMIQSVEQRMTTIRRESGRRIEMSELKDAIKQSFASHFQFELIETPITSEEHSEIERIERDRYLASDWIFQRSAQEDMDGMSLRKTKAGLLRTYIALKGETIKSVLITGDFLDGSTQIARIESKLKWSLVDKESIHKIVLAELQSSESHDLSPEDITEAIWMAAQRELAATRYTYKGSCYYPKENNPIEIVN